MTMIVKQDGREVEIPREVEAEGGDVIDAYVAEQLGKPIPARPRRKPATLGGDA